jgi:hypothetical protein
LHAVIRSAINCSSISSPPSYSPHLGPKPERVREYLEDDAAVGGAVTRMPQRREAQGVGGVVGEVEAALG